MPIQLMRVVSDEVLVRHQPRRIIQSVVRNVKLVYGQLLAVRTETRTEADGFIWWEHAQQPGWWSAGSKLKGKDIYLEPYTPPAGRRPDGADATAAVVLFRVVVPALHRRQQPGGALLPGPLPVGTQVSLRADSCCEHNGFYWWQAADGGWLAAGSTAGDQVFLQPVAAARPGLRLEVPRVSQVARAAVDTSDGGLAGVLMLLHYYGHAPAAPVAAPETLTAPQAQHIAAQHGLALDCFDLPAAAGVAALRDALRAGRAILLLTRYKLVGTGNPHLRNLNRDVWLVLCGFEDETFFVHDALWLSWEGGTALPVTAERLGYAAGATVAAPGRLYGVW
ncbi:MAG: hypothetical protein MUE40_16200 [Anaerolineae bacterium]|jgi:hypothetical protein|nr:hypothetical protein [Anaerolineae bacterium]